MNFLRRKYLENHKNVVYFFRKLLWKKTGHPGGTGISLPMHQDMHKKAEPGIPITEENAAEAAENEVGMEHFVEETRLEQFWRRLEEKKAGER